jgi:outer membrane protein assembly factor BamB/tetratricopeptide (TPR) repeat protein
VIAPDDAAPIFAFEAATGKLAWKSPPLDKAVHLLGFGSGGIVATGDHVWMIDPGAGTIKSTWPEVGSYDGYGRGLLAGGSIYWPTRTDIKVLDQAAGTPGGHSPIRLQQQFGTSGGNLAVGDGYLVIAQRDALVVFAGNARLIEDYREEIAREPTNAASRFRLARVAEAIGEDTLALENLQKAVELARPEDTLDGRALADEARGRLHRIRMKLGAQALEAKQYETAADHLAAAAAAATGDRDRLAARLKLAEAQEGRGDLATAVATLQTILADEKLRLLTVEVDAPDSGRFVRAEVWIARGLERLLRQGGRSLYAGYDAEAKRLLERGEAADDPRQIEAIAAAYPVAEIVPDAWASLGRMHARLDRPAAAARAWKRLLASAPNDTWRALALVELAAVLETQGLGTEAREAYLQAKTRYGDVELPPRLAGSAPASISARVSERLARAPLAGLLDARLEPDLAWPLERRTEVRWPTPLRPILPAGLPEGEAPHFFALDGVKLRPLQLETDSPQWTADLEQAPQWLGYAAGRLIAATPTRFAAFDTRSGQLVWQYPAPGGAEAAGEPAGAQADPFARENSSTPRGRFHSVRLVSDQILCLQGDRSVLALDAETGSPNWIESPPSGSILPHWLVNPSRVAVQLRGPSLLLVLDTRSGRRLAQFPRAEEDGYWARDPFPLDDDRAAVVLDSRAVALLDLTRGVHLWTQQNRVVLPSASLPRFLGNAEHLILVSEGGELARLNPNTGDHLWNRRLTLDDLTETPDSLAIDPEQLYAAAAGKLHALDLDDGEITWSRPLAGPDSHWRLNLVERHVLAYPAPPSGTDAKLDELPILALRRDSGRPTQRIVISGPIHELALRHDARGLELVFDHGAWTLNTAEQAFNPP